MSAAKPAPHAKFTVVTLGVADMRRSIAFYDAMGFARKMKATGEQVAFFETGATMVALYPWSKLAADADLPGVPVPEGFLGVTLAWNCADVAEVDAAMAHALACGARLVRAAGPTEYGGYRGYVADPDGHLWEMVTAPDVDVTADGHVKLPD